MSIARIPAHDARDRKALADYLVKTAAQVAAGRVACDPYGVVVILIGPEGEDIGSRGLIVRNDYRRVIRAALHRLRDHAYGQIGNPR